MKVVFWLLGFLALVVAGFGLFVWFGGYNVAADEPHWPITQYLMETTRKRSIEVRASDIDVPGLEDESLIRAGAGNYDAMCTGCHLRPGLEETEQSKGLFPAPPNLARRGIEDSAAAFWVIKHGVKMSGMPAWGKSMEDEHIWGIVAFLRRLPELAPDAYQELVAASGGHQHGGFESGSATENQGTHEHAEGEADEPHSHESDGNSKDDDHSKAPPHQH